MKKNKYHIVTADEVEMVRIVQAEHIEGLMWPNGEPTFFHLVLTEEELVVLRLRIAFDYTLIEKNVG